MELGQKLRQARIEQGLSQRQLCGGTITRNMLSQIENGSARPSMSTLGYLAGRLGKPVSYFLGEQTVDLPNVQVLRRARESYAAGDPQLALQQLEDYQAPDALFDPERLLLAALCRMALAQQAIREGRDIYARTLLEQAGALKRQTPYDSPALERERLLLMYSAGASAQPIAEQLPKDDRELLLLAQAALEAGDYAQSHRTLDAARVKDVRWHYRKGQAALAQKDYATAAEHFLLAEEAYPQACAALEQCYRELEDYKKAYYYACKQRNA